MAALDTNILVRWLVQDDAAQTTAVAALFAAQATDTMRWFVPVTVLLELEWVLRSRYRFDKTAVIHALDALLSTAELDLQHEAAIEQALWHYRPAGAPDFADCLHTALASHLGHGPLITLDQRAAKLQGAQLLSVLP